MAHPFGPISSVSGGRTKAFDGAPGGGRLANIKAQPKPQFMMGATGKVRFEPLEPRLLLAADLAFAGAADLTLDFVDSGPSEIFRLKNTTGGAVIASVSKADWSGLDLLTGPALIF